MRTLGLPGPSASRARALFPFAAVVSGLLFAISAMFAPAATAGAPRVIGESSAGSAEPTARVITHSSSSVDLEFNFPSLVMEDLAIDGETYQLLTIPGGAASGEVGEPMLPTFSRMVAIPDRADAHITVTAEDTEEVSGVRVLPMQSEDGAVFALDQAAYSRTGYGTAPQGSIGSPALLRGLRVVPLTLSPVQYSPADGKLRVAHRLRVNVSFGGENLLNVATRPARVTPSFDKLYRALVVNYEGPSTDTAIEGGSWLLICNNSPDVLSRLQPLIDWRQRMGYHVRVATTDETGHTKELIQAYIRNAYNTWTYPPEFIVMAGDADGTYSVPTWFDQVGYGGEGDHPYGQLEGDDILIDAHIGRLSFGSLTDLEVIVAKIVGYESAPNVSDPTWFTRSTLVGDPIDSGYSTVMVQQWIKTRLREIGYTQIDTIFNSPFVSQMSTSLNRGGSIFCYRGIQGMSGWTNTYTNSLTNFNKLYYGVMSTCGTGSFFQNTARSEGFLRAGTVAAPKAAVGAIGTSTTGTHTRFNNCFTYGLFQGLLYEDMPEMGAALTRGKYELWANYEQSGPNYVIMFSYWNNLMGDPACKVWTAAPVPLTVNYPSSVFYGENSVQVSVLDQGLPCPGAQVCLWKGSETFSVGTTDAQGVCELPVSFSTPGTMKLTVTKHNCAPYLADISVAANGAFVGYQGSSIDDDASGLSAGNGNGQVNPGETIELAAQIRNYEAVSLDNVTAVLTSTDPYVTISDGNAFYGTIQPLASLWDVDGFVFSVDAGCPQGHVLRFAFDIHSGSSQWHSLIDLPVSSSDLQAGTVTLYNAGNGRLDPGETLQISVPLSNTDGVDAVGTTAVLSSLSPWITVLDAAGSYGTITAGTTGENTGDHFTIGASSATYQGYLAGFRIVTTFNGGAHDTTYASVTVGAATSVDPIGPDRYGYVALDNTDTAYPGAPVYNWIEINPAIGGSGTQVSLGDYYEYQDKSLTANLPFAFRFYGQDFTRATICSNGWIAMGDTYLSDYRNWTIPGAGAPHNLIAPFWDDLYETNTGGHVFQYYDPANHWWVVEWSRMANAANYVNETFEVILYDPAYFPTVTGDGKIRFQYNSVANVDGIDGYSTVGIQNWDHTDGLLYTYFNRYPAAAATLTGGRAIQFTTLSLDPTAAPEQEVAAPVTSLEANAINPFRGSTAIRFSLSTATSARLTVFDVQGRVVRHLLDGPRAAGAQSVLWDGADESGRAVPSGVYFYRLETEGRELVRKVMKVE